MSALSDIVLSQTQTGPHMMYVGDVLLLVSIVAVIVLVFPAIQKMPLVKHE